MCWFYYAMHCVSRLSTLWIAREHFFFLFTIFSNSVTKYFFKFIIWHCIVLKFDLIIYFDLYSMRLLRCQNKHSNIRIILDFAKKCHFIVYNKQKELRDQFEQNERIQGFSFVITVWTINLFFYPFNFFLIVTDLFFSNSFFAIKLAENLTSWFILIFLKGYYSVKRQF